MAEQLKNNSPLVRRKMFYRKAAEMGTLRLSAGWRWWFIPAFLLGLVLFALYGARKGVEVSLQPFFRVLKWWKEPYDLR